ncbi:MAG: hypothetical protein R2734_14115 [Nocardioides sp.]
MSSTCRRGRSPTRADCHRPYARPPGKDDLQSDTPQRCRAPQHADELRATLLRLLRPNL